MFFLFPFLRHTHAILMAVTMHFGLRITLYTGRIEEEVIAKEKRGGGGRGEDMTEKAIVNSASRSIHLEKSWVFSFGFGKKLKTVNAESGSWFQVLPT